MECKSEWTSTLRWQPRPEHQGGHRRTDCSTAHLPIGDTRRRAGPGACNTSNSRSFTAYRRSYCLSVLTDLETAQPRWQVRWLTPPLKKFQTIFPFHKMTWWRCVYIETLSWLSLNKFINSKLTVCEIFPFSSIDMTVKYTVLSKRKSRE